jgi:hypothetical protein
MKRLSIILLIILFPFSTWSMVTEQYFPEYTADGTVQTSISDEDGYDTHPQSKYHQQAWQGHRMARFKIRLSHQSRFHKYWIGYTFNMGLDTSEHGILQVKIINYKVTNIASSEYPAEWDVEINNMSDTGMVDSYVWHCFERKSKNSQDEKIYCNPLKR